MALISPFRSIYTRSIVSISSVNADFRTPCITSSSHSKARFRSASINLPSLKSNILFHSTNFANALLRLMSQPKPRCKKTITKQVATTAKKGDAPTIARLSVAPSVMVIILSKGVRTPKERLPDIRIKMKAIAKTAIPRQPICSVVRFFPSPNISINEFIALK